MTDDKEIPKLNIPRVPKGETSQEVGASPERVRTTEPKNQPEPISIRLESIRRMDDDALMRWLTTESEHPGRPLAEGTRLAITMELMRRQSERVREPHRPSLHLAAVAAIAAVLGTLLSAAGLGYMVWQDRRNDSPPAVAASPILSPPGSQSSEPNLPASKTSKPEARP